MLVGLSLMFISFRLQNKQRKPQKRLILINDNVIDYQLLVSDIDDAEVIVLDHENDDINTVNALLKSQHGLTSLHILSHGKPGGFALGNTQLTTHNFSLHQEGLASWKQAFHEDASMFIYSCRLASGKNGKDLIQLINEATGVSVAASIDYTGGRKAGGDWDLEYVKGRHIKDLIVSTATKQQYQRVLTSGGPDTFGYTFIDSDEVGGTIAFEDISGSGTATGLNDDGEINVTMPFEFNLYGTVSRTIRIGANGAIRFNQTSGNVGATNRNLPRAGVGLLISPYWDDLFPENTGEIYYETKGTAPNRRFVVQWQTVEHFDLTGPTITFEAILYEGTNNIDFVYADTDFGNVSYNDATTATIGIQDGSDNLQYSFNTTSLSGISSIRITHPGNNTNMSYTSSTTTQTNTSSVLTSSVDQEIIGVEVVLSGNDNPFLVTAFDLSTIGSTNASGDIQNAKLYYSGTGPEFDNAVQFGSTASNPSGSFTISGSQTLVNGTNYFWLTYDISSGTTEGNVVDAASSQITINGINRVPSTTAPTGSRSIASGNGFTCAIPEIINLTCGTVNLTGDTSSGSAGSESTCNGEGFNAFEKFWFSFTGDGADVTATTVDISDPNLDDTKIWVYSGNAGSCGGLTCVTADDDGGAGLYSSVTFSTSIGTNYYIVVGGFGATDVGGFQLNVSSNCMAFASSTATQNTSTVETAANNEQIIGLEVVTTGSSNPLELSEIIFNTDGSSDPTQDFYNAKVFYTGTSNTFAATNQFGSTVAAPLGKFEITGTQALSEGTNYFWLTYNIQGKATLLNLVDAEVVQFTLNNTDITPSVTAPGGERSIVSPATSGNGSNCSAATFLDNCNNSTASGSTSGAINPGFSGCGSNPAGGVIWYSIEGNGNTVTVSTDNAGTDYDTYLWLFSGSCTSLICEDNDDDGGTGLTSEITFTAAANTTYYIGIGGFQANEGNFELSVDVGTPNCMSYVSSTTTQNENPTSIGRTKQHVVGVEVVTSNDFNPLSITSLSFNTTGTTAISDISNARLYYTGSSSVFASNNQFGAIESSPDGNFIFSDDQSLVGGTNYFWLTYDITAGASEGNEVDAQCTQITVDGSNNTPTITAPSGSRTIESISPRRANALSFDGIDDYVDITSYKGITGNNNRTVEAWVKAATTEGPIISWGTAASGGKWTVSIEDNSGTGQLRLDVEGGHLVGTTDLFDNTWHHIAVVFSGTNVTDAFLYVDGELESISSSSAVTINTAAGNDVRIGGNSPDGNYLNAEIEEVRLWSMARNQGQIRDNMHLTLTGTESNLVGYWQFNESGGTVANDFIAAGNSGTYGDGSNSATFPSVVASTVPIGAGISNRRTISGTGNTVFGTTRLSMNFTTWSGGSEEFVVYQITGEEAPGNNPLTDIAALTSRFPYYWIVRQFGSATFNTNISMVLGTGLISIDDESTPNNLKLIKRPSNSFGTWSDDYSGNSANRISGEVVFNGVSSFSQINVGTTGNSALPVELLSFTASERHGFVFLNWETASEINNDYFKVQRSEYGENWETIGEVYGNGTLNSFSSYEFADSEPLFGISYYRLKQIDFDGRFEFSHILSVNNEFPDHLDRMQAQVYPNPTNVQNINVRLLSTNDRNNVEIKLIDLSGRSYYHKTLAASAFSSDLQIRPIRAMRSGIYIMEIKQGMYSSKLKIIIL